MNKLINVFRQVADGDILCYIDGRVRRDIYYDKVKDLFYRETLDLDNEWISQKIDDVYVISELEYIFKNKIDFDFRGMN